VYKQFIVLAGITIAVLHGELGRTQTNTQLPGSASRSQCRIISTTSGSLVSNINPPSELLPDRLMTVRVICDRQSTVTAFIEDGRSDIQNGLAEIAFVSSSNSGTYSVLPSIPNWSNSASFTVLPTQNPRGDYFLVAARIKAGSDKLLKSGSYRLRIKITVQPIP
jgi:hypothetical protein